MRNMSRHHYVTTMTGILLKEDDALRAEKTVLANSIDNSGDRR